MDVDQLALIWVGRPNGKNLRRLESKFDLDQNERISTQIQVRPSQTESQVDPNLRLRSARALRWGFSLTLQTQMSST